MLIFSSLDDDNSSKLSHPRYIIRQRKISENSEDIGNFEFITPNKGSRSASRISRTTYKHSDKTEKEEDDEIIKDNKKNKDILEERNK